MTTRVTRINVYVENHTISGLYPIGWGLDDFEFEDGPNEIPPRETAKAFRLKNNTGPALREEFIGYFIGRPGGGPMVRFGFLLGSADNLGGPLKLSVRAVPPSGMPCKVSHSANEDFHEVSFIFG